MVLSAPGVSMWVGYLDGAVSESLPSNPKRGELQGLPTVSLLTRARDGDARARNVLLQRHRPALIHWVHGRLPVRARDDQDTEDIVQRSLIRALEPLERFAPRHEGAFLAYLCQIAHHLMLDDLRKVRRRPARVELEDDHSDGGPSPLDKAIDSDDLLRYEEALLRVPEDYRIAIRLKLELDYSYAEMAAAMDRPTENAARLLLQRGVKRLAREMNARRRRTGPRP